MLYRHSTVQQHTSRTTRRRTEAGDRPRDSLPWAPGRQTDRQTERERAAEPGQYYRWPAGAAYNPAAPQWPAALSASPADGGLPHSGSYPSSTGSPVSNTQHTCSEPCATGPLRHRNNSRDIYCVCEAMMEWIVSAHTFYEGVLKGQRGGVGGVSRFAKYFLNVVQATRQLQDTA